MDLRRNTQVVVRVGPFVDATDGVTPETGVALGTADQAEVLKHTGGVIDISGRTWAAVTNCDAWYDLTLTASDVDTEGMITIIVQDSSVCRPVHVRFMVKDEHEYDSEYDITKLMGKKWFVKTAGNGGSDSNSGRSFEEAFATPAAALTAAGKYDTIYIDDGEFTFTGTFNPTDSKDGLRMIGRGPDRTKLTSTTATCLDIDCNNGYFEGITFETTASGAYYGVFFGNGTSHNEVYHCHGVGDYDGFHMGSTGTHHKLSRCYGKGKFDGIQAGSGSYHLIHDCIAETDGSNTITSVTNAFVSSGCDGLFINRLHCIARRSLTGDTQHLSGFRIQNGSCIAKQVSIDVEHTASSGDHETSAILIEGSAVVQLSDIGIKKIVANSGKKYIIFDKSSNGSAQIGFSAMPDHVAPSPNYGVDSAVEPSYAGHSTVDNVTSTTVFRVDNAFWELLPDDTINNFVLIWKTSANGNSGNLHTVTDYERDEGNARGTITISPAASNTIAVGDDFNLYSIYNSESKHVKRTGSTPGPMAVSGLILTASEVEGTITYTSPIGTTIIDSNVDAIKTKTDNHPANLNTDLQTVDSNVDAIKAKTDNHPANLSTDLSAVDTVVDAIKLKTDNLPASPAAVGSQMDIVDAPNATAVTALQNGLSTLTLANVQSAVFDYVGVTAGGVIDYKKIMKVVFAYMGGRWQDKSGAPGVYEILDPDDGTTVIAEITPGSASPQRTVNIL